MGCKSLKNITTNRLGAGRIYTEADSPSTNHGALPPSIIYRAYVSVGESYFVKISIDK